MALVVELRCSLNTYVEALTGMINSATTTLFQEPSDKP